MLWRAKWSAVFWANRSVGVPSCLAPLRPTTPPCVASSRPAHDMLGFWISQVHFTSLFGHTLYEERLQRQLGDRSLASSQEQRASVAPGINQSSTGYHSVVNRVFYSSLALHRTLCSGFRRFVQHSCLRRFARARTDTSASRVAPLCQPRRPPCAGPPQLAHGMSGF